MKPITTDDFIQNICHECGEECPVLCDQMRFLNNIGDKYKIYTLASSLEIAEESFKIAKIKETLKDFEGSSSYYKSAYNNLKSASTAKETLPTSELPEEPK